MLHYGHDYNIEKDKKKADKEKKDLAKKKAKLKAKEKKEAKKIAKENEKNSNVHVKVKKIHGHSPSDMKMTPSSFGKRGGVFTGNRITWLFSKKKLKPSE